jgi:hypothetical protein
LNVVRSRVADQSRKAKHAGERDNCDRRSGPQAKSPQ